MALLGGEGYARMTMERVAARAGVPKTTLYRRWPTKKSLTSAIVERFQETAQGPPSGDPKRDLVRTLERLRKTLGNAKAMGVMGALLAEEGKNPELIRAYRRKVLDPRRKQLSKALTQPCGKNAVHRKVDADLVATLLMGGLFGQYLRSGRISKAWPEQAVDALWGGLKSSKKTSR